MASKRTALILVAIPLAALILVEVGLRIWSIQMFSAARIETVGAPNLQDIMPADRERIWAFLPDVDSYRIETMRAVSESGNVPVGPPFVVSTDQLGLRRDPSPVSNPEVRILAVGDSTTFGFGVNDSETWPVRLRELLNQSGGASVQVYNGGVPGYSALQSFRQLRAMAPVLEPDIVIVTAGSNDGEEWNTIGDRQSIDLMAEVRPLSPVPLLFTLVRGLLASSERFSDGKRPRLSVPEFEDTLAALHEYCKARGIVAVFVPWPTREQMLAVRAKANDSVEHSTAFPYQDAMRRIANERGIVCVALAEPFAAHASDPFTDSVHVNGDGNAIVAREVAPICRRIMTE